MKSGNHTKIKADLYLRLSDFRTDDMDSFPDREAKLRAKASELGWEVHRVVVENDRTDDGRRKPASAYKRQRVMDRDGKPVMRFGRPVYRVLREGWQGVLTDLGTGAATALLAEDLDRTARDPRDIEDLIDAIGACRGHACSLSGSLMLTDGGSSDQLAMARVMVTMANKSSADTARRVSDARERLAGKSYGGGRRPFGFRPDPDAPNGVKTLIIVEAEAEVIRRAAWEILDRGVSLKAVARDLRDRGVPTVTGTRWSTSILRDVLIKPATAGLTVHRGELRPAPWPAILERDVWERLRDMMNDSSRRTNNGRANEPRWLVSGIARCGVCKDGTSVHVTGGRERGPGYICDEHNHLRRNAAHVDRYIGYVVVTKLSKDDAADLLRPPARPGTDADALRAEARKLREKKAKLGALFADDVIDADALASGTKVIRDRLVFIDSQLAASDAPDPLAEFRDNPADVVWESLSIARRRTIVKRLFESITIVPTGRKGAGFDPDSIVIVGRTS